MIKKNITVTLDRYVDGQGFKRVEADVGFDSLMIQLFVDPKGDEVMLKFSPGDLRELADEWDRQREAQFRA